METVEQTNQLSVTTETYVFTVIKSYLRIDNGKRCVICTIFLFTGTMILIIIQYNYTK